MSLPVIAPSDLVVQTSFHYTSQWADHYKKAIKSSDGGVLQMITPTTYAGNAWNRIIQNTYLLVHYHISITPVSATKAGNISILPILICDRTNGNPPLYRTRYGASLNISSTDIGNNKFLSGTLMLVRGVHYFDDTYQISLDLSGDNLPTSGIVNLNTEYCIFVESGGYVDTSPESDPSLPTEQESRIKLSDLNL